MPLQHFSCAYPPFALATLSSSVDIIFLVFFRGVFFAAVVISPFSFFLIAADF